MINRVSDPLVRKTIVQNFEREANILATLNHLSIPRIYDYFSEDNRSCLVLEFIHGKDLEAIINETGGFLTEERGHSGETYILGGGRLTVWEVAECIWKAAGGWHMGFWLPDWVADLAAGVLPLLMDDPLVTPYSLAAVRSNSHISHEKAMRELGFRPRPARQAILDAVRWWQERLCEPSPIPETIARAAA